MSELRLLTGDYNLIKEEIQKMANGIDVVYSKNILSDLNFQYGLWYKPKLLYFLYDPSEISDKESVTTLINKTKTLKYPVVCVIETDIDKRSYFYTTFSKRIEVIGETKQEKTLDEKVVDFYNNINNIIEVTPKESISFLYKLFYNYKHKEYKNNAGYCINLVLTGRVKNDKILKVFFLKCLDKQNKIW